MKIIKFFFILSILNYCSNFFCAEQKSDSWHISVIINGYPQEISIDENNLFLSYDQLLKYCSRYCKSEKIVVITWKPKDRDWFTKVEKDFVSIQIPSDNLNREGENLSEEDIMNQFNLPKAHSELSYKFSITKEMSKHIYLIINCPNDDECSIS